MFSKKISGGLLASAVALAIGAGAAAAEGAGGAIDAAAAQLAAASDSFAASSAALEVLPLKLAGSCPRAFLLKIDLGAAAPGKLSYRIETLDGRVSQVFEAKARAQQDGGFAAQARHEIALRADADGEAAFSRIAFSAPTLPAGEPAPEPDFFQRLFGTAAPADPSRGLGKQSFRVKVVAPNEVVSTFDQPSVTCEDREILRSADESQHDGGDDRPGRDGPGRDPGGRDGRGGGAAGAAGAL